ncbi:glyoxalase/bleomycin resistance/dioxygenase family protein [Arenimonas oryziterrae]|uniref:Glyoxalase-like domain-containing protein n=1 Tax=Arenimonas oryziterrae DSM 21050 = YC6267 TaxID=1121015 RepID=A0A091ASA7_9GAMM|nr:glyoxalase/bleomycin resistance/dioxygenase family protein [Arenimonas oryziterrae]KFN43063.1 hypothetical protein N789_10905 [Arenimonas oryziterrae DSM 21050 = YC6267]
MSLPSAAAVIFVDNVERMTAFYQAIAGMAMVFWRDGWSERWP